MRSVTLALCVSVLAGGFPASVVADGSGQEDRTSVLLNAALAGQTELVRKTLDRGADANAKGGDGRTALMLAAFDGHTGTLRVLLEGGAKVDDRDGLGRTALMYAASGPNPASVQLLLEWKANPLAVDQEEQFTALMFAAAEGQAEVVRVLIDHGADVNAKTQPGVISYNFWREARTRGETPLHRAAAFASIETIKVLLHAGANRILDVNGDSPLAWASWHRRTRNIIDLLLDHSSGDSVA